MSINEIFIQTIENRIRELTADCKTLIRAVEDYVEPKPGGDYMHRSKLLSIKNELKAKLK